MTNLTEAEKSLALAMGVSWEQFEAYRRPTVPSEEQVYKEGRALISLLFHCERSLPIPVRRELRAEYVGKHPMLDEWMEQNPLPEENK